MFFYEKVSTPKKPYIIAEAGVNHNGDINIALKLIEEAKKIGVDCIKFQTFKAERLVTKYSPKAMYQTKVTDVNESQYEMLKSLELDMADFKVLQNHCAKIGIDFLSTPYNKEDVDMLSDIGVTGFKVASGQLTELPFIKYLSSKGKTVILSTGMANMAEVFSAVEAVRETGNEDLVVLQCTTNYPSAIEDSNIQAMVSIREACKVTVGYSDHVPNNYACYAAVALGASIIEKHFTLDKKMAGPDHSSSLDPGEFRELVLGIQNVSSALGNGIKKPSAKEAENSYGMKRSLVLLTDLPAGAVLKEDCIGFKRPSNGLPPNYLTLVLGKKLARPMKKDEPLIFDSILW